MKNTKPLKINVLDGFSVVLDHQEMALPKSKKTRALLLYLLLNPKPHSRNTLCNLLWEDNDDPKGALRWALAKLRPILPNALDSDRQTVGMNFDLIQLDLALTESFQDTLKFEQVRSLEESFNSPYLNGFDSDENHIYQLWLDSQRSEIKKKHRKILEWLSLHSSSEEECFHYLRKWLLIDPFNIEAITATLTLLIKREGVHEAHKLLETIQTNWTKNGLNTIELIQSWKKLTKQAIPDSASSLNLESDFSEFKEITDTVTLPIPQMPSIAVMGFRVISGEFSSILAQGLTVDLTGKLSRLNNFFVSSHASASRMLHQDYSLPEIGRSLGVKYLLLGTIQSSSEKIRITIDLIKSETQQSLWSENYTINKHEIFDLQDDIVGKIISRIEPEIEKSEFNSAASKNPNSLNAWENYHMALWHGFKFTSTHTELSYNYLKRALTLDPLFSRAEAALSFVHFSRAFLHSSSSPQKEIQNAIRCAKRSIDIDNDDAMGYWSLGRALFLNKQHDSALEAIDSSLIINPNYAQGHYVKGFIAAHANAHTLAIDGLDKAKRLSPFDPLMFAIKSSRAISLITQGDYETAVKWAISATNEPNAHFHIYLIAAAALVLDGQLNEARNYMEGVLKENPRYNQRMFFESFPYKNEKDKNTIKRAFTELGLES